MKCIKCKFNNNDNANYCYRCGYQFSSEDRNNAKNSGFYGVLRKIVSINDIIHLNKPITRILVLLIVIAIGVYNTFITSEPITLNNSSSYTFKQDKETNTYVIYTDEDQISADLKLPTNYKSVDVELKNGKKTLKENNVSVKKDITLKLTSTGNYYRISYKNKHDIFIYVVKTGTQITEEK